MREGLPIPIRMIDMTINEVIDEYPTMAQCAHDNRMDIKTIRDALERNRVTRAGYRFERVK